MRNLKKFLALVLAMMMAFSLLATANAQNPNYDYPDVKDATFTEAIDVLTGMGVFRGDNGNFKPSANIMRSEAVAVLYRLVTGDVTDSQKDLYAPAAAYFTDVAPTAWYAGYVGFAVDAGFIKGFNGEFNPNGYVTGYEMLAMLLRAVGYGKNGEFTGSQWMVNVGATAQSLGILDSIQSSDFANTLAKASPREVVAELTFQTAAYVPTVRYEYGYYNQYQGVAIATGTNKLNPTLGAKVFGLTGITGIIVGNQATGEDETLLGIAYEYGKTANKIYNGVSYAYGDSTDANTNEGTEGYTNYTFDIDTGLNLFGHKATVWYNGYTHAYAVIDEAEMAEYVYAEDGNLGTGGKLNGAVTGKGFKLTSAKTAHFSDRYSQINDTLEGNITDTGAVSPISTYAVISNNGKKTVDVVIALSAEVAQITQKNTTAKDPYVVLGYSGVANVSSFGDGTTAGKILEDALTADSVKDLGKVVTAYEVIGTAKTLSEAKTLSGATYDGAMYQLDDMKSFTATVSSYKLGTAAASTVVAVDGTTSDVISVSLVGRSDPMLLSGITRGNGTYSEIISGILTVVESLRANTTYTVYEDIVGRFISLETDSPYKFLYGTYADFEVGGLGTGTIKYNMVGVDIDGEKQGSNTINSISNTPIDGTEYNKLTVTRKDYGISGNGGNSTAGNELNSGYDTAYLYNAATGDLQLYAGGKKVTGEADWTIKSSDAASGFAKVTNDHVDYLLTKDTQFIVVSGTGTATLDVKMYKGLADFLQGAAEAVIGYTTGEDEVIYMTEAEEYGTVDTNNNGVITKVILSEDNLNRWNSTTMYFNFNTTAETGMVLPGTNKDNVKQYALWCNGELDYYFVDISVSTNVSLGEGPVTEKAFYNLVKINEVGGVPVYKATRANSNNGTGDLTSAGYASNDITYKYITVSTLDTGLFEDTSASNLQKVFSIAGAKVCDVQAKTGGATTRNEITTLRELNNAVSVRNPNGSTAVYGIEVAIVYDGINVATIYVTDVTG